MVQKVSEKKMVILGIRQKVVLENIMAKYDISMVMMLMMLLMSMQKQVKLTVRLAVLIKRTLR